MKKIVKLITVCGIMLCSVSCGQNDTSNIVNNNNEIISEEEIDKVFRIPEENIASFKVSQVMTRDLLVQVNNMIVTKKLPETVEKYKVDYFYEVCEEDGTLSEEYQYVFLDLTLENKLDTEREIYLNSMRIGHIDERNRLCSPIGEMRYRSGYDFEGMAPKDFYRQVLKAHETIDVTVGFIVEDNFFEVPNSCIYINLTGAAGSSEAKMIRLTSEELI